MLHAVKPRAPMPEKTGEVTCLLLAWTVIVLSIWKGAKVIGKVVHVTVLLPWLLLIILVVRGVTLPGAVDGLNFSLTPGWPLLLDSEVWLQAYT